jgi:hypothetical protein
VSPSQTAAGEIAATAVGAELAANAVVANAIASALPIAIAASRQHFILAISSWVVFILV